MRVNERISGLGPRRAKDAKALCHLWCLLIMAVAVILAARTSSTAQRPVQLEPLGGPGGNYFEYICGPGRVLVGVRGYAGVWLDNVQAVCARVDINGVKLSDSQPEGPVFGGNRPINQETHCPTETAARGLAAVNNKDKPFLGYIEPLCADSFSREFLPNSMSIKGTGVLASLNYTADRLHEHCPPNMFAIGIRGRAGQFLDALGLVCAHKPVPPSVITTFMGKKVSLSFPSWNYPDRYVRHRNSLGFIEPPVDDLGKQDATFSLVPGLAGKCFSLESHNYPDHFLRHQGFRLKLAKRSDDQLFRQDATFCIVAGFGSGLTFESVNIPGHYIRHRNFELWLDHYDGSELFRKDATFDIKAPLVR